MVRRILLAAAFTLAASGAQAQPLGQFSNSGPIDFGRPLLFGGAAIRQTAPSVALRLPVETIKPEAVRLPNVRPAAATLTPPAPAEPPVGPPPEPAPSAAAEVKK